MKILMASILNMDADMNGVVVTAKEQQDLLNHHQHTVTLITPYTYAHASFHFNALRWTSVAFMRSGLSIFAMLNLLVKGLILAHQTIKLRKAHTVFHAHDLISAMVFLILSRRGDVTLLNAHFHTAPWDEFVLGGYIKRHSISYKLMKFLFLRTLRAAQLNLMPVSKRNLGLLQSMVPGSSSSSVVLYPGISAIQTGATNSIQGSYLINVGSLDARKNQLVLIDILADLEKQGISIPLVLVGPEEITEKQRILDRISALSLRSPVYILGKLDVKATQRLIQSALLYVHTSRNESFGRTLVEAMSLQTPVIAFEYEAVSEILDPSAVINTNWSNADIATFLKTLIESPALREDFQQKQHKKYLQTFTQEQMLNTYTQTIERTWRVSA